MDDKNVGKIIRALEQISKSLSGIHSELKLIRQEKEKRKDGTNDG